MRLSSSCSPCSAWEQPWIESALESAHKRGHESNRTRAGSNCSFLLKCSVSLKRSMAFSLTTVKGWRLSNPTYKKGFCAIVGWERGSAEGENTYPTQMLYYYYTRPSLSWKGKQANQWDGRWLALHNMVATVAQLASIQQLSYFFSLQFPWCWNIKQGF